MKYRISPIKNAAIEILAQSVILVFQFLAVGCAFLTPFITLGLITYFHM